MNGSEQVSKTAVLTDSASDIPRELEEKYGIDILPFSIVVDGQSYTERVDFTNEQYYEMLTKAEGIPKTSQITMLRFLEKFGLLTGKIAKQLANCLKHPAENSNLPLKKHSGILYNLRNRLHRCGQRKKKEKQEHTGS